jgi:diadenosine tetraphosphatase ApaH/serine/threonine PP2A family protein phosphatase
MAGMRTAILSDVHSNLEALEAVLDDAQCERVLVLGDLVGYNADPQAVLDLLQTSGTLLIAGNHDLAATGRFNIDWFNPVAATALLWTVDNLDAAALDRLLVLEPLGRDGSRLLVHGSVRDPAAEYLLDADAAAASFGTADFDVGFFGHTHVPAAFELDGGRVRGLALSGDGDALSLKRASRYLLNPGSVGQPRDADPRAAYLIADGERIEWRRVAYDVARTQKKIRSAGLPDVLAARLEMGR